MRHYPVTCYAAGCDEPAHFKIAADWSDGVTREWKTYSLSCERHVDELLAEASRRRKLCRTTPGESLGEPAARRWP